MNYINIICKLNEDDNFDIDEDSTIVNLSNKDHFHYNFWDNKNLFKLPKFFRPEALDLFYLSLFIFYADRIIPRDMFYDAWTRNIRLYIPVLQIDKFNANQHLIEEMLSYLSGDNIQLIFRKREFNTIENKFSKKFDKSNEPKFNYQKVCMLSGGLDSFIGAIDLLQSTDKIAFIGHYGGGKGVLAYQKLVKESLSSTYNLSEYNYFNFFATPLKGKEDTTRTRSFMFFAHAIAIASSMQNDIELYIPENGLISLNIPLTNSRLGSSSTRTTHPYYMSLLQQLLINLHLQISLINPYQFKTKGEMILECSNQSFLTSNIPKTMSCSHPDQNRYQGETEPAHCGTCLPCVIRRAALKKGNISGVEYYTDSSFNSPSAKKNLKAYMIGIEKYKTIPYKNLVFHIQKSGKILINIDNYASVYKRGMSELINLLDDYNDNTST